MSVRPDPNSPAALAPDARRLSALASYDILDTPAEQGFDGLVQLARTLCDAPVALVSLVGDDRQWFKANAGFLRCETDLDSSVCKFVLAEPDVLVIPDLAADPRTAANPLVTGEPFVRFYAGAPLRTDEGRVLGSLCVLDHRPRPAGLGPTQADGLRLLAAQAMQHLEARRALAERNDVLALQDAALRRERRLETLALASEALFGSDDPAGALEPILAGAAHALGFDQSYVYAVDAGDRTLTLTGAIGVNEAVRASLRRVSFDVPLCGIVAETGHPLILEAVQAGSEPRHRIARDGGIDAFASYPVTGAGQTLGVISFGSTLQSAYDEEALQFFGTVARLLSLAEERRTAGRRVAVSEAHYKAIFESATDHGIIVLDRAGEVTDWNAGAESILGWSAGEMVGKPADVFFTPEDRAAGIPEKEMHGALSEGRGVDERWHLRKSGERFWANGEMMPLRAPDGSHLGFVKILRDRTEQRRTGEALAETAANLQRAQEAGGIGLFTVRLSDNVLLATPEFCRLYGLPERDSYPATAFEALVIPEDAHLVSTTATRDSGAPPRDVEYRIRRADDGALRWIARKAEILADGRGRPARFSGVSRDVTEQRAIRAALAASEQRYRTLFETIDEGFCVIRFLDGPHGPSSDYVHVEANPGYERNTGIAGIVGRTIRDLAPDEADGWVETYREVLDTGRAVRFERDFVAAGRRIEVAAHRVEPADRREVALLFRDITARRDAERALVDSEQRLSLAFEASGTVGWYDWDIPPDRMRGSDAFARMFGVSPGMAAAGAPLADFMRAIHPGDLAAVGVEIQTAMMGHPGFDSQYRLVGADGTVTWVHSLGRISYDPAGHPVRFTGVVTDVTSSKRAGERQAALLELSAGLRDGGTPEAIALMGARVLGETLGVGRVGYGTVAADGETFTVTRDWTAPAFPSLAGTYRMDDYGGYARDLREGRDVVIADTRADPRTVDSAPVLERVSVRALVNLPVIERGRIVAVLYLNAARPRAWDPDEVAFARQVASLVRQATERRHAEERQALLNHELSHRLKNILAMVQAIATQTLRNAPDAASARETLASRLIALGKAHDILMHGTGESADLAVVVEGALAVHDDDGWTRFRIEGPPVTCAPQPALSVALMMHELATNAAKYGALSRPEGRVSVTWALGGGAEGRDLTLVWRECGGPTVTPPTRRGFGSKLIERGLAGSVGGITELDYPPEGVVCTLTAPVAGFRGEA